MSDLQYIIKLLELICRFLDLEYQGIRDGVIYRYQIIDLTDNEPLRTFATHRQAQNFFNVYGLSEQKYSIKQIEYFLKNN